MSKEERFELSSCLFNESDMDFIRDKKTNEEYVVLDELVPILNRQDQQIADLEAKLAESEKKLKDYELVIKLDIPVIKQLEQQLAEKDEEIKQLKLDLGMFKSVNEFLNSYGIEKAREVLLQTEKTKHQDKISFCVEQLEMFRDTMEKINENNSGYIIRFSSMRDREKFHEALDNQIKQLKEMK